jgi:pectin methylesterase-like acyl-CoA thioesterase
LRNINLLTTSPGVVLSLIGGNIAFYGCSIISPGLGAVTSSFGVALFANCYIEGTDKIFYNYPTIYVYKSTIVPLQSSTNIVYNKGANSNCVFYNSTVVFDSCTVQRKQGSIVSGVYLGAPNAAGAVAIYRNSDLGPLIAPVGVHPYAALYPSFYGKYESTGAGAYISNSAARASYDVLMTPELISQFTIERVYGNAPAPYGGSSLSWIQGDIVASIKSSNAVRPVDSVSATASMALTSVSRPLSTSTSISPSTVSNISLSSSAVPSTVSSSLSSSSTEFALPIASTPASVSSSAAVCSSTAAPTAYVVSKTPGLCEYGTATAAINALPNDDKSYTIKIGAGTYTEQISITRNGKVTLIGETKFPNDYMQNKVRLQFSSGRLTNLGQNEQTPTIYAKKANDDSGFAVYNIDFVNTYPQTYNTAALAADLYGANIAAYGCSFIGFQNTLLANKGVQVFVNSYIEGSVDLIWDFSVADFYHCKLVSNTPGACIAAQSRATADTAGGYVFDACLVTYSSTYGNSFGTTYLGRPYSQFSVAVYVNSYLDKHINPAGWSIWNTSNPQTSGVLFGEFNNSGPGSGESGTKRANFATKLTAEQAAKYKLSAWIGDTSWIDMNAYNAMPSYSLTGPSLSTPSPPSNMTLPNNGMTPVSNTTSSTTGHASSGIIPPEGAVTSP